MSTAVANPKSAAQVVNIPTDLVVPSDHQPRFMANPQAMAELIESIRARGIARVPSRFQRRWVRARRSSRLRIAR